MAISAVDVTFEGLDTLQAIVKQAPANANKWIANELFDMMTTAFNESQRQAPVDTGHLRGSGTMQVVTPSPFVGVIGYGGASAPYALAVHENLAAHHKAPTKAKYLEDPVNQVAQSSSQQLQATVEAAIIGNLPQSPSAEVTGEMAGAAKVAKGGRRSRHLHGHLGAPRPMNDVEIRTAMAAIDHGQELARRGKRNIRTFHRSRNLPRTSS
jgi:hypothetical protein